MVGAVFGVILILWVVGELVSGRLLGERRPSRQITRNEFPQTYWMSITAHAVIVMAYLIFYGVAVWSWYHAPIETFIPPNPPDAREHRFAHTRTRP